METDGQLGIYLENELPTTYEKYTYDAFNRLTSTKTNKTAATTYKYYPNNLRLSKKTGNNYIGFIWDGNQIAAEFDSNYNTTNAYAFGAGQQRIIGTNTATNAKTYYLYNPHGDVQGLTNENGSLTKAYDYDAFGNEIGKVDSDTNPWRYCGEYFDEETDNIYLRNRYYNPATGAFTTEDPVRSGGNWYSYCGGNPVRYIDPLGLKLSVANNSSEHQKMIIEGYASMTTDKIGVHSNGDVYIVQRRDSKACPESTQMIRSLINSRYTTHITINTTEDARCKTVARDPKDTYYIDGKRGKGSDNEITIYLKNIENEEQYYRDSHYICFLHPKTFRTTLIHESVHAYRNINGMSLSNNESNKMNWTFIEKNKKTLFYERTFLVSKDELETVGLIESASGCTVNENAIRRELGIGELGVYS